VCGVNSAASSPILLYGISQRCVGGTGGADLRSDFAASFPSALGAPDRIWLGGVNWGSDHAAWEWTDVIQPDTDGREAPHPNYREMPEK
jgi:hypothetical protein